MKLLITLTCLLLCTALAGCDMRSDTAKREMEKFSGTPTPTISPVPTETPIDPSEVVQIDVNLDGETLDVDGDNQKKSIACTKFNRVSVNGDRNVVTIKGACRQIMINGHRNQITSDAVMEYVVNGDESVITYSRYVNGKRPIIKDYATGSSIQKVEASGGKH